MRALTIIQPFAHLIATGVKRVENRTWPTHYRGPLAIHAGKARSYNGTSVAEMCEDDDIDPATLAFGAVVAVAELVDCVALTPGRLTATSYQRDLTPAWAAAKHQWLDDHEHREGPVCWVLANVRRLAVPVVVNGDRGLWEWTPAGPLVYGGPVRRPEVEAPSLFAPRPPAQEAAHA
jgi:hypothetical protein